MSADPASVAPIVIAAYSDEDTTNYSFVLEQFVP